MKALSGIPLSHTKVVLPRRRDELLSRTRLLNLLNRSLDKKLVLISAPAGYGKTSLLIDLANNSELPICWLSLDELDRDPHRFVAYLIAALAERFPSFGRQSMSVLNGMVSLETGLESFTVTLTNEMYAHIREHFVLVLDDYHLVDDVPLIRNFVSRFLKLVDENCHMILSSRLLVALPDLPRMVALNEVDGLDFSELAFRPEEIQAWLRKSRQMDISEDAARSLAEQSEGWITGLQLAGVSGDGELGSRLSRITGVDLTSYFDQQALSGQLPVIRSILLYTSLFNEFDVELCRHILDGLFDEPQDWPNILKTILSNNLFVLPVGDEGRWLRYHHLFRDFLQSRLLADQPEIVPEIRTRLVRYYEQRGEWERAYYTCLRFNDPDRLADLVERAGPTMLRRAVSTLTDWLNALPPAISNSRPGLLSLRGGIGYLRGNYQDSLSLLNQAEQLYRASGDVAGLALALVRRATAHRNLGDYTTSLHDAEEALQLTENDSNLQLDHAEAQRVKGLSLYRLGNIRQSIDCLERSLALYEHFQEVDSIPILSMNCGMVHRAAGNFDAAERFYRKALEIWRADGNLAWQSSVLNNMGTMYHTLGDYEKAAISLQEGLNCARQSRYLQAQATIAIALGELYAELEEYEGARESLEHAEEIVRETGDGILQNYLAIIQASLALQQERSDQAESILLGVQGAIQKGKSQYELGLWNLVKGRCLLASKDARASLVFLQEAEQCFLEGGRELETMWSRVWLVAALSSMKDAGVQDKLRELLRSQNLLSHALVAAFRQARPWLANLKSEPALGRLAGPLFQRANNLDAHLPTLRRALRRLPHVVTLTAPRLVIQGLGWPHVTVNGKPAEWQTQSVRELFFYFLVSGKPVNKEQVAEALWADTEDPDRLRQRFKNELYRLRRAVGQEVIVLEGDLYRFNRSLDYDYDVDEFETRLARAKASTDQKEQLENLEKAVALVKGPYLADVGATWAILDRERIQQKVINAAIRLAELQWERGEYEKAMDASQRTLEFDPAYEPAHQMLMRVFDARGDRAGVIRQFKICKDTLERIFGLPPSQETEVLFRKLSA